MQIELPPSVRPLFSAFEAHGLKWVLLRPAASTFSGQSDVDLLISSTDFPRAAAILYDAGFLEVPVPDYGTHRHFVRYDADEDRWAWMDVVTEIRFGEYGCIRIPVEEHCLKHRRITGPVAQLAEADLFWVLLLRCVLDKARFSDLDVMRLRECVAYASADDEVALSAESVLSSCRPPELLQMVVRGEWMALEELSRSILRNMYAFRSRHCWRVLPYKLDAVRKLASRFRRRGIGVALCSRDTDTGSLIALVELSAEPPLRALCRRRGVLTVVIDQRAFDSTMNLLSACVRTLFHKMLGRLVIWHVPFEVPAKRAVWLRMAGIDCTFEFTPGGRWNDGLRHVCFDSSASESVCRRIIVESIWRVYISRWGWQTTG